MHMLGSICVRELKLLQQGCQPRYTQLYDDQVTFHFSSFHLDGLQQMNSQKQLQNLRSLGWILQDYG